MANIFDFGFKEYKIKLDGSYFMGGYFAVMGDTARRVEVRLLGTDNVVRDASGLRLQLWADAGGKVSYVEGEAVEPEKGRYRFDLINGLLLSPGVQKFQWRIIDSDGRKINSIQFNGRVGNDLEGDAWEGVHQLYLNTGQLKKEVDEVRKLQDDLKKSFNDETNKVKANFKEEADRITGLQKDLIDGAVDSAAIQQNVEERYSDLEAEYASDLSALKRSDENITAQLAQTANREEVFTKDKGININDLDEPTRQTFLEAQGIDVNYVLGAKNIKEINILENAVTPAVSSFFYKSPNLLNPTEVLRGKSFDLDGYIMDDPTRMISGYIRVEPGETIHFSVTSVRIALYDENKENPERVGTSSGSYTIPQGQTDYYYMRVSMTLNNYDLGQVMINKGSELLPFVPFSEKIKNEFLPEIPDGIDTEKLKEELRKESEFYFESSANLLNPEEITYGKTLDVSGNVADDPNYILSGFIPVKEGETIQSSVSALRIALYDENKENPKRVGTSSGSYDIVPEKGRQFRYMRLSMTLNDYTDDTMINKGDSLLPYQPYGLYIKKEYLPPVIDSDVNEDSVIEILSSFNAKNPYPPRLQLTEVSRDFAKPYWLSEDGTVLFGHQGSRPMMSMDEWETRQRIGTEDLPYFINGIRELPDGELIASVNRDDANSINARVYKTSGFDRKNPSQATWHKVLDVLSSQANIQNSWGFDYYENIVVLSEYGLKGVEGGNYVYFSDDYGETFTPIFDLKSTEVPNRPPWTDWAHTHTVCYDPYFDRIWLATGDDTNTAVYYTDNHGGRWSFVEGSNRVQFTGIIALEDSVVFGSDRAPNGVYIYRRKDKGSMPVINEWFTINNETYLTHIFQLPFRRERKKGMPVYFGATSSNAIDTTLVMGFVDGLKPHILYESEPIHMTGAGAGIATALGDTAQGNVIVVKDEPEVGTVVYKAPAPAWE